MPTFFHPIVILLALSASALGQSSVFDLIHSSESTEAPRMVVTLPLDSIDARTRADQPAVVNLTDRSGQTRQFSAKISLRGKFRRRRCENPPLKLDFDKSELEAAGLARYDKYKLVAPCYDDTVATELLFKEYLAYRAYAILSPDAHFRTQLLRITYRDLDGKGPDRHSYGFLIEETDEMAHRSGGKELDQAIGLPAERYNPGSEATHALFQYFIGNGDWSLPLQRNVKVVALEDSSLVPVGYDFDFSGWVGAPYASPSPDYGQRSIYERVYLGYHQSNQVLDDAASAFIEQRRSIKHLITDFKLLSGRERLNIQRFVNRFYERLDDLRHPAGSDLYLHLRGESAEIVPPGAEPKSYLPDTAVR